MHIIPRFHSVCLRVSRVWCLVAHGIRFTGVLMCIFYAEIISYYRTQLQEGWWKTSELVNVSLSKRLCFFVSKKNTYTLPYWYMLGRLMSYTFQH